ncbi:MAG TPA: hydrolase [Longimicrobiales bacterium]|nr:hydrolase [Longimicrobiales bacterium]
MPELRPAVPSPTPAPASRTAAFDPRPFRPARGLRGAHAQTIAGRVLRRAALPPLRRERIELPDGDFVDLDAIAARDENAPLVLLLHGLEGSARRGYAIGAYRELARHGLRAVGMNFRSCSGEPNRGARFYHSGDTGDLRFVVGLLRARCPDVPLGAIGFSLGGNVLLKYLGETGAEAPFDAAVAVSVPYDLAAGADALDASRIGRLYARLFLRSLIAKADTKAALLADRCDLARVRAARSLREFDDAATAPLHGFANAADYYARSSSRGFLERIRIPTLLLHAADDPFLPAAAFPAREIAANPYLRALLTERGGHVGFIEGSVWAPRFWAEQHAAGFLAGLLAPPPAGV